MKDPKSVIIVVAVGLLVVLLFIVVVWASSPSDQEKTASFSSCTQSSVGVFGYNVWAELKMTKYGGYRKGVFLISEYPGSTETVCTNFCQRAGALRGSDTAISHLSADPSIMQMVAGDAPCAAFKVLVTNGRASFVRLPLDPTAGDMP